MEVNSALVNLALLESLKGNKVADEIDLFVPYLALAICSLEEDSFGIIEIKKCFDDLFSISPPEAALKVILTRAKKNGLVRLSNHQYFKVPEKLNLILEGTREKKKEVEISLSILISEFVNYSKSHHKSDIFLLSTSLQLLFNKHANMKFYRSFTLVAIFIGLLAFLIGAFTG